MQSQAQIFRLDVIFVLKKKKNNKVEKILAFEIKMRIFDVIPALQRETLYVKTQIKLVDVTPEEIYNKLSSLQIGQNTYN